MLSHGIGNTSFVNHENLPFTVSGIWRPQAPVDRTIHVSLQDEAIHLGWQNGAQVAPWVLKEGPRLVDLQPTQITAVLLSPGNTDGCFWFAACYQQLSP